MEHESHESSNHFCFRTDEVGNLTRECIVDRLTAMAWKERTTYNYNRFLFLPHVPGQRNRPPNSSTNSITSVNPEWRASICKWSYNVADYFEISREVVAISMSLFDRFFATRGCKCNSNLVLLVSIATLHIAIKVGQRC